MEAIETATEEFDNPDKRYLMVELSCKDFKCKPCTYPDCQRYVRLKEKPKMTTKVFEVEKPPVSKEGYRQWYMFVELACSEKQCDPCTYPNCQRYKREVLDKKKFKVKTMELKKSEDLSGIFEGGE